MWLKPKPPASATTLTTTTSPHPSGSSDRNYFNPKIEGLRSTFPTSTGSYSPSKVPLPRLKASTTAKTSQHLGSSPPSKGCLPNSSRQPCALKVPPVVMQSSPLVLHTPSSHATPNSLPPRSFCRCSDGCHIANIVYNRHPIRCRSD